MFPIEPGSPNTSAAAVASPSLEVSRRTLETIPGRALAFLRPIPQDQELRRLLGRYGYGAKAHAEGWRLLHAASNFDAPTLPESNADEAARAAASALDDADEKVFRVASASLARRFPEQHAYLLHDIGPSRGGGAVLAIEILLDRLDAMPTAPERSATREADSAAIALLAERGLHANERARLRALVEAAKLVAPVPEAPVDAAKAEADYLARLVALRDWYVEWSEIAKAAITRRDRLIRLGLATPRAREDGKDDTEEDLSASAPGGAVAGVGAPKG